MQTHITLKSSNAKTGPIPVTSTERASCSPSCPFFDDGGCYGENHGLNFHWNAIDRKERGFSWNELCHTVEHDIPDLQLWRHNQVGDLPHKKGHIDGKKVGNLVLANKGKKGFTYTHHDMSIGKNAVYIKGCNDFGFTVNLSANNTVHADTLAGLGIAPVVVTLLSTQTENLITPGGRKIVICPATQKKGFTCADCGLCAIPDRKTIIGFPAHGTSKKKVEHVVKFYKA
jgi:hypothetical protein